MTKLVYLLAMVVISMMVVVDGSMLPPTMSRSPSGSRSVLAGVEIHSLTSLPPHLLEHDADANEETPAHLSQFDASLMESMSRSRTSSPYLHEVLERTTADLAAMGEETDQLMTRVEGEKSAAEIRKLLEPYLHPTAHASLQQEPPPPLVSSARQRQLRTEHMKHVLEMKYAKMHARAKTSAEADSVLAAHVGKVANVSNHAMKKSSEDDRSYRFITLANGLRAVLVSDPNTTKSAAAMDVGNGYLSDPRNIPGLAHFLEHMLFLGTKKYPSESAYADFIESNGGFSNAYTAMENTNYYFDILPNHLFGALDRFAQFFISPLLNVNTTEREMKAVDAEHSKNILSDNWRANRLLQDIANISHPYSKFGTGCAQTLDVMPHAEMQTHLRRFWSEHYTANNLFLSVIGSETLDQLQAVVDEKFSAIRPSTKKYDPLAGTTYKDVFNSTILGSEVFVNTIEDSRWISLIFPLESQYPKYRYQAVSYIRTFIESRGRDSLLKQLKSKGWATGVQIGIDAGTSQFATVQLSVDLTLEGTKHMDQIVAAFFAVLNVVRKNGIQEWRFKEMQVISNLTFTYKDKEQPSDYISKLASNLRHYPPEDVLVGGKIFLDFSAKEIELVLDRLTPDNMLLIVGGKELNHQMRFKEKWYGIEYDVQKINAKRLKYWKHSTKVTSKNWKFSLAPKSDFLPTNLKVAPPLLNPVPRPIIIYESMKNVTDGSKRLWYSEDLEFHRPHGHAIFRMYVPSIYSSPRNYLLTNIWVSLLEDQVDEELYSALLAGFASHFRVGTCYVDLIFHGYNQGLIRYGQKLAQILNPKSGFKPDQQRFNVYKETLLQSYLNKKYEAPHRQSSTLLASLLDPRMMSNYDLVRTLELLTFDDVKSWSQVLFSDMSLEAYVHGNVHPKLARKLLDMFVKEMPFKTTSAAFHNVATRNHYIPRPRLGQVKEDVAVTMLAPNPQETNSAIVKYWQYGMGGIEGKLYSQLLALIGQKPIFHQLRTLEQLGYIVWSSADNRLDVNGFKIQVQSGRRAAHYLSQRIDAMIVQFQKKLAAMTQKQFEAYIETLMMSKLQSPVSMAVQTSWFWSEISRQEYIFQRKEIELYILNATQIINRAGFQNFVEKLFYISDVDAAGVQSCELRGGGVLSVRIESPVPQVAIVNKAALKGKGKIAAAKKGAKAVKAAEALVKKHKLGGAKKKKGKKPPTKPAQARRQAAHNKKKAALKAKNKKAQAQSEAQHKSLLDIGTDGALDAMAEAEDRLAAEEDAALAAEMAADSDLHVLVESDAEVEGETEAESESESEVDADSEIDSESETEVDADADADAETDAFAEVENELESEFESILDSESVFLELDASHSPSVAAGVELDPHDPLMPQQADTEHALPHAVHTPAEGDVHGHSHGHAHAHAEKKPSAKKRALVKGAGPFLVAGKQAKDVEISSLDQPIVIITRARDGGMYLLNTTQSTVHVFTDSMMLYPRNRYEPPPNVTEWKNVKPKETIDDEKLAKSSAKKVKSQSVKVGVAAKIAKATSPAVKANAKKVVAASKKSKKMVQPKMKMNKNKKKNDRKKKPKSAKKKNNKGGKKA